MIGGLEGGNFHTACLAIGASRGACDPQAALAWVDTLEQNDATRQMRQLVMCCWAGADPEGTYAHLMALPAEEHRAWIDRSIGGSVWRVMARGKPWHAKQSLRPEHTLTDVLTERFEPGSRERRELLIAMKASHIPARRQRAMQQRLDELSIDDPRAALALGKEMEVFDPGASRRVLAGHAAVNPQAALQLAREKGGAIDAVFAGWARADVEAALEAVDNLPEAERLAAIEGWRSVVAESDPAVAAATYALGTGAGEIADKAAATQRKLLETWFQRDPNAASRWAATLTEEQGRGDAVEALYQYWDKQGLGDAAARLVEAGFSDEELPEE